MCLSHLPLKNEYITKEREMQITANINVETGYYGSNVGYITTAQGLVLIDTPPRPTDALDWSRVVARKGQVKYLINTEPHWDHYFGNFFFPVPVIANDKTREAILAVSKEQILERIAQVDPEGLPLVTDYQVNAPCITFSECLTLHLDSHTLQLINLPGHTIGETAVFIPEERLVFSGDNVFYKLQTFLHDADPFAWLESLRKLGKLEVDYIVPGHGEVCNNSYLAEQANFIQEWIDVVRKGIDQGWTKEEAMARISMLDRYPMLPGEPDFMGPELQRWNVSRLYDLLYSK